MYNKLIWRILYRFIAYYLPVSNFKINLFGKSIRYFLAKRIMTKCGKNVNIERRASFSSKTEIGDNSGIGINAYITGKTIFGSNVLMGPDCIIYTWNHNYMKKNELIRNQGREEIRPVIIGDDVWIGGRVIIMPGVRIGNGVVVGAGSIVTKDVPDYAVVAGNPARIIKYRS